MTNEQLEDKIRLLTTTVAELASRFGSSGLNNPISLGLLCLEMSFTNDEMEKIIVAFNKYADDMDSEELILDDFRKILNKIHPADYEGFYTDRLVKAFIKASAIGYVTALYPYIDDLD